MSRTALSMLLGPLVFVAAGAASGAGKAKQLGRAPVPPLSPVSADVKAVAEGNNEFALDLYARLSKEKGNVVYSPYSISTALAMTYAGARGQTAEEMAKVLHFTLGQERLHPAFGKLIDDVQKEHMDHIYHLYIANALWPQRGFGLRKEFLELTDKNYRARPTEVDYAGNPEEARLAINRWVEAETKNKIKELLKPGDVTRQIHLFLTNAIYFKASWMRPFRKADTKDGVFAISDGKSVSVPMMTDHGLFNYVEDDDWQWLELPYKGDRLSMVLLLPKRKGRLAELEEKLTATSIRHGVEKLRCHLGPVFLPRFKITTRRYLNEDLKAMGMPLAFGGGDFSGIAPELTIAIVVHKAFIDVDEEGTEAAAATAVGMGRSDHPSFSFRADHPFLFLIRDKQTGSVLFMGRVADPSSRGGDVKAVNAQSPAFLASGDATMPTRGGFVVGASAAVLGVAVMLGSILLLRSLRRPKELR